MRYMQGPAPSSAPLPVTHRASVHPYELSLHIEIPEANPGILLVDVSHQEVLGGDAYGPSCPFQKARVGSYPRPSWHPIHLLLLAVNADQPPFEVTAGESGLDPLLGALAKIVALLLEIEPVLGTCAACYSWGHT